MKSRRATPQLTLSFEPRSKLSVVSHPLTLDQSPFDPSEFDAELDEPVGRSSERVGRESGRSEEALLRPSRPTEPPSRRARVVRGTPRAVPVSFDHAHRLAGELKTLVGSPVKLHIHDNRSTMVSFRRESDHLHLRVHHMFLGAGPDVVRALADYARARSPKAGKVLDHYVRLNREAIKPVDEEEARTRPLRTEGDVYDLAEVYQELNGHYFGGMVDARIGWGRGTTSRRRRSIRMGAYYHDTETILIHPALDRTEVPRYFLELVVYHEMLHQAVPQRRTANGRRCIHSPEFRAREALFADFERAHAWEQRNLSILLRPSRPR